MIESRKSYLRACYNIEREKNSFPCQLLPALVTQRSMNCGYSRLLKYILVPIVDYDSFTSPVIFSHCPILISTNLKLELFQLQLLRIPWCSLTLLFAYKLFVTELVNTFSTRREWDSSLLIYYSLPCHCCGVVVFSLIWLLLACLNTKEPSMRF